jgi:type VI secretion system protein
MICSAGLNSCGFGIWVNSLFGGKMNVKIVNSPNANLNNPVQLDLLLVYDEALLKQMLQMTARDWFEKRDEIRKNYPDGQGYDSWQWEWIPGQAIAPQQLPLRASAVGALVFTNYFTSGPHRFRVNPHKDVVISLLEKECQVETVE